MMMVTVLIMTIPTALIFFMQKQFVAGMTGSVKG